MNRYLTALILLVGLAEISAVRLSNSHEWASYKSKHGKTYASSEDEARRFAIFMTTKARVESHNANSSNPFKLGLNHMSDWTEEEFAHINGLKVSESWQSTRPSAKAEKFLETLLSNDSKPVPDEIDWRRVAGRVSNVKDQKMCGSCWAFATTGLLEGQQLPHKFTKELIPLSEQNLMDCSGKNLGCYGGMIDKAIQDIHTNGGIMSEIDYPYNANYQDCMFDKSQSVMTDSDASVMAVGDEEKIKELVAKYGPVATAMTGTANLKDYQSGLLIDPMCNDFKINHAVLIVGYGTDPKHGDFWIVKNSWSDKWGEQGYFRIKRGSNMCHIASLPTIATF